MEFLNHQFSFTDGIAEFIVDSKKGTETKVCKNYVQPCKILETTDNGLPLVLEYNIGKGKVILFNVLEYPAHEAIKDIYENIVIKEILKATQNEEVWAKTGNDVGFSLYKQPDGSAHVYFLAVD